MSVQTSNNISQRQSLELTPYDMQKDNLSTGFERYTVRRLVRLATFQFRLSSQAFLDE